LQKDGAISVIIPVFREQETINRYLGFLKAIFLSPGHEIIVVDGSFHAESIKAIQVPGIRTVHSKPGRGAQMNAGAGAAAGRILVFVHADTILPAKAPELIIKALEETNISAGAFSLGIDSGRTSLKLVAMAANLRTWWTRVPYGDQAIFMSRDYFFCIGGFMEIPLMEDLELMTRIRKRKDKVRILPQKVLTSSRRWNKEGVFRCTLRNWFIRVLYHFGVSPDSLKKLYK